MSKKGRHRKGGRTTPKRTRPIRAGQPWGEPGRDPNGPHDPSDPDELLRDIRRRLHDDDPVAFAEFASSLVNVADPRSRNPFEAPTDAEEDDLGANIVDAFIRFRSPETSALLAVMAEFTDDDIVRRRIRRELALRDPLPRAWLRTLGQVTPYRAVEMSHVLGDGDNIILGARFPDGHEFSLTVYIDHNVGTLVKDAYTVPKPIEALVQLMKDTIDDPDMSFRELDLADARTRIADAITIGAMTVPPFETETWPAIRPLTEWIIRMLPEGGTGYERPEWSETDLDALQQRFVESSYGAGLDDEDNQEMLEAILWFGSGYGPGDPMRWSAVAVELLLADWLPRKIAAPAERLVKAPDVLRAFIRFCHAERGIRPALTAETLAAVDHWEPHYQETIRSPRLQGADAILARIGAIDPDGLLDDLEDDFDDLDDEFDEFDDDIDPGAMAPIMLDRLSWMVGGTEALANLDTEPLPDEPFAWAGIPADIHDPVAEVVELVDRACDELLDRECRTACRRFLARAASRGPNVFRRKVRADSSAAAVLWAVGQGNDLFAPWTGRMMVKDLMAYFGRPKGSPTQRAKVLLEAGGFDYPSYGPIDLGSADFLVSAARARIVEARDKYTSMLDED